ncbi:signal recognition particle-docking protein FtsY [Picrophilus oshimae]|uniref:Signal recognition particle receptor FtsY n=1 Tax=Picrophilus torridus (strain ATCC 700027 / DSM 9790 / JCM 10055 / NBRC 100828 / KAW 2/3) TaxID=1122961 RepID=Q6KYV1_PICTO|nr:signal recognition particle-docking protein FtsY [Picrophilus oshimae]AAT44101.1 signal recognition particle receptor FtsY [Picrophilus oshimae DSM 9789]
MFDSLKKKLAGLFKKESKDDENLNVNEKVNENISNKSENQESLFIKRDEFDERVQEILIESDVSFESAERIVEMLKNREKKLSRKISYDDIKSNLRSVLYDVLSQAKSDLDLLNVDKKPYVILFIGINGTGKTTTIGKIASYLKNNNKKVVIAAGDTFRAGAIEQISIIGEKTGTEVIKHDFGSDPASVAYDAIEHARARRIDYVLIDSAGRMQTNKNLLSEMKKIKRVARPDLTLLVLDGMIGNDAIEQAKTFMNEINFDGVVLTKLDTDARGGAVISVAMEIKKPIMFVGVGQGLNDIMRFDPDWYLDKIFSS